MPSGKIFLKHNFSSVTGYLIIALFENSSPAAELVTKRITIPAPHVERGDTISELNPVMHTAKFYQSTDGLTLETLILTMALDASIYNENQVAQYDYVVDRGDGSGSDITWADPVTNDTQIIDERLDGYTKDEIRFEMRGGTVYRQDEYALVAGGGVELLGGEVFGDSGNTYRITVFKTVAQQSSGVSTSGGSEFGLRVLENADFTAGSIDFDTDMYDMINVINYTGAIATVVFPNLALVQNTKVRFTTHLNPARNLIIQLDSGDTVKFRGVTGNEVILGRGEEIELRVKDGAIYVTYYSGDAGRVGQRIWGDKLELNSLYRDGTTYNQADYPRLMAYIDTLGPGQVVDYTTWNSSVLVTVPDTGTNISVNPYKSMFARDDIAGTFRVPDDRDKFIRALKFTDGSDDTGRLVDLPGGYQHDAVGEVNDTRGNSLGTTNTADTYQAGPFRFKTFKQNPGLESRVKNLGMLPLIII